MTALRERAETLYYSLHTRVFSSPEDIAKIESTLQALVEECIKILDESEGDIDFAKFKLAQVIREKGGRK